MLSVTEEFESCFTHENNAQQGSFQLILPVLEKQRFDREKLRCSVCWWSDLGSHRINLWVSVKENGRFNPRFFDTGGLK